MKYIVSVSGGVGSTLAAHITADKFGLENIELVFADTRTEDDSLYALLDMMSERLKPVIRLDQGMNIWECFDKHGIIRTPTGACKASLELKQKPIAKWVKENCSEDDVIVSGLDWSEEDRIKRFNARWKPFECYHPLDEHKMQYCDMQKRLKELNYPIQEMYNKSYPHNNCGGTCVLAGLSQWAGVKKDFPVRFEKAKQWEKKFNEGREKKYSILKRQNSTDNTLMLDEFEKLLDENKINIRDFRTSCSCMVEQLSWMDLLK